MGYFPVDWVAADHLPLPARHRCSRVHRFDPSLPQVPGYLLPGAAGAGDAGQCQRAAAAAGLLILVAVAVRTGQAGSRLPGPAGPRSPVPNVNRDDDRFWKGGLIYVNRDDPAIMAS